MIKAMSTLVGALLWAGAALAGADEDAVRHLLHSTFDKPDAHLVVEPVVVSGGYAIAGWTQADMGGRALLRSQHERWAIILCAGDAIKAKDAMIRAGVPAQQATDLEQNLALAEGKLSPNALAMFSRFEGLVMMDGTRNVHH